VVVAENLREGLRGKLAALIGIEYLWAAIAINRLLQGIDTEGAVECIGQPPGQYHPAVPVHNGDEVTKSLCHGDVCDVGSPNLIGARDLKAAQQIGILAMADVGDGQARFHIQRHNAHLAHQTTDLAATDAMALGPQFIADLATAVEWIGHVDFIDQAHPFQVYRVDRNRLIINAGSGKLQQFALTCHGEFCSFLDHRLALASPIRPSATDKKSFSIDN